MKVHINEKDSIPPEDDHYFLVAGNGIFLRIRNGFVDAVIPVSAIDGLEHVQVEAKLLLPRITSTVFAKAVRFFYDVYKRQKTEAAVLLHYSEKLGYALSVPPQRATFGHVEFPPTQRLPGHKCVGTLHSHGSMNAFHSSTDIRDEAAHNGIHITIGRLDKFPFFALDGEYVINGTRFPLSHEHIIRVKLAPENPLEKQMGKFFPSREKLYTIPFGILRDWQVPNEWLQKVKKQGSVSVRTKRRQEASYIAIEPRTVDDRFAGFGQEATPIALEASKKGKDEK
jgi:hypothetical protein